MLEAVLFAVAGVMLLIGTITDIRTREVPDWLNFAGIAAGIGVRSLWSLSANEWSALLSGVLGFAAFFIIAVLMYYTGQWGGGDSKLMMALGALFGLAFSLDNAAIGFIVWLLFVGAAYGMLWSAVLAVRNWRAFVQRCGMLAKSIRWAHGPVLAVLLFGIAFAIASDDSAMRVLMLVIALAVPVLFYTSIGVKAVEQCCMLRTVRTGQLTEGDWIAKPVHVKGKYVCGPKDLGVTKEKISMLKRLKVKSVMIKEGIPFVPSFLIAFFLLALLGSPLQWFF